MRQITGDAELVMAITRTCILIIATTMLGGCDPMHDIYLDNHSSTTVIAEMQYITGTSIVPSKTEKVVGTCLRPNRSHLWIRDENGKLLAEKDLTVQYQYQHYKNGQFQYVYPDDFN